MSEQKFHLGVKALIVNGRGEVLVLRANPKLLAGDKKAYWDIPGGRIKEGSSMQETLEREVEEELGIKIGELKASGQFDACISNHTIPVCDERVGLALFTFYFKLPKKRELVLSDEHTEHRWTSPTEAAKLLSDKFPKSFTDKLRHLK